MGRGRFTHRDGTAEKTLDQDSSAKKVILAGPDGELSPFHACLLSLMDKLIEEQEKTNEYLAEIIGGKL